MNCGVININMTNREKFNSTFNIYLDELWAMPENQFLKWAENKYTSEATSSEYKQFICGHCGYRYHANAETQWDEFFHFNYWNATCPNCGTENEVNDCYWR